MVTPRHTHGVIPEKNDRAPSSATTRVVLQRCSVYPWGKYFCGRRYTTSSSKQQATMFCGGWNFRALRFSIHHVTAKIRFNDMAAVLIGMEMGMNVRFFLNQLAKILQ
jgi:hypothetical protein